MAETQRVKIKDAAAEIGCQPEYLRRQMKSGRWELGEAVRTPGGTYEYFVFRRKLDKFLGKEE